MVLLTLSFTLKKQVDWSLLLYKFIFTCCIIICWLLNQEILFSTVKGEHILNWQRMVRRKNTLPIVFKNNITRIIFYSIKYTFYLNSLTSCKSRVSMLIKYIPVWRIHQEQAQDLSILSASLVLITQKFKTKNTYKSISWAAFLFKRTKRAGVTNYKTEHIH